MLTTQVESASGGALPHETALLSDPNGRRCRDDFETIDRPTRKQVVGNWADRLSRVPVTVELRFEQSIRKAAISAMHKPRVYAVASATTLGRSAPAFTRGSAAT